MSDEAVAAQYEAYPYPTRNPQDEKTRLIEGSPSHLDEVCHYIFAGRLPKGRTFRALIAGGGTGDAAIMLAQHAADWGLDAEIVYLDLSVTARAVAESRAAARGLSSIRFLTGSILDAAALAPGPYDYIDCCGVLHHLADPAAGLRALVDVMSPTGGMGLMVYAPFGRDGVYPLQSALRRLGQDLPPSDRVAIARQLLPVLPETNGFVRNPWVGDHRMSDAGLYDLLLHERDRAFTVMELAEMVEAAGLEIAAFMQPIRYRPEIYVKQPRLLSRAQALPPLDQAALAEELAGNMKVHIVYVVGQGRSSEAVADLEDAELCPTLTDRSLMDWVRSFRPGNVLSGDLDGVALRLPMPRLTGAILSRIDGRTDLPALHRAVAAAGPRELTWRDFQMQFTQLYAAFNGAGKLHLRRP